MPDTSHSHLTPLITSFWEDDLQKVIDMAITTLVCCIYEKEGSQDHSESHCTIDNNDDDDDDDDQHRHDDLDHDPASLPNAYERS